MPQQAETTPVPVLEYRAPRRIARPYLIVIISVLALGVCAFVWRRLTRVPAPPPPMSAALLWQGRCISVAPAVGDLLWYSDLSWRPPRNGPKQYRSEDLPYGAAQLVCTPWDELLELKNPKAKGLRSVYVGTIQRPNSGPRLVGLRLESIIQMTEPPGGFLKFYAYVVRPGSAGTDPSIETWDQSTGDFLSFAASGFRIFADSRDRSDPSTLLFYCELDNRARVIEVKLGADGSIKAGWRPATSEPLGPFAP